MNSKAKKITAFITGLTVMLSSPALMEFKNPTEVSAIQASYQKEFFNKHGETARKVAAEKDLFASVMLAQMALESNYGRSGLSAAPINNYFGIKGSYNGNSVSLNTKEDDGKGNLYTIKSNFRSYPSAMESMYDYSALLSNNRYYNARKSVAGNYQSATSSLQGVYATDTSYASKLNQLISTYNLSQYDSGSKPQDTTQNDGGTYIINNTQSVNDGGVYTVKKIEKESNKKTSNPTKKFLTYKVVKGDSLDKIARKYKTTVSILKQDNGLTSDLILIGDKLKIEDKVATKKAIQVSNAKQVVKTHKIKKGETLSGIAKKYNTSILILKKINGFNSDVIVAGKTMKVK